MILATTDTESIDPFPALQELIEVLDYYRNVDVPTRNLRMNALIEELCGKQTEEFEFKGARLEADVNEGHPDWMTTGLRVSFLVARNDGSIRVFEVTADFGAKLQGKFN